MQNHTNVFFFSFTFFLKFRPFKNIYFEISAILFNLAHTFLVLPFLNFMWIIINLFYFMNGSPWYLQSFEIFFVVLNGCKIIEFFTTIRPFYINEYKIYL